jgi:hypothetical protein
MPSSDAMDSLSDAQRTPAVAARRATGAPGAPEPSGAPERSGTPEAQVVSGRRGALGDEGAHSPVPYPGASSDRGFVTVEAAGALPVLVLFTVMLLWGLTAACAQMQCIDGARAGARAVARSESEASAVSAARSAAPLGAEVVLRRDGDLVRVLVEARALGPGPLGLRLHSEAAALAEDAVDPAGGAADAPAAGAAAGAGAEAGEVRS